MRYRASRLVGIALLLLAVACTAGLGFGAAPMTLNIANMADVIKLDPAFITDTPTNNVATHIFDRLVRRSPDGIVIPGLATSWTPSADGLTWTFNLRRGVKFHDGTPFDAKAVAFTYNRLKDKALASPGSKDVKNVTEVVVVDEDTVQFKLAAPQAGFLDVVILSSRAAIVSPAAVQKWGKDFSSHPVGTGPFKFVEWVPDTKVVLAKNEDYFLGAPKLDRLVFRPIPDASTQLIELETGGVDMILKVQPTDMERVKNNPALVLHSEPDYSATYIFMHCSKFPFNDVRVRRAINHAVPVERLLKVLLKDAVSPLDSALPKCSWAYTRPKTQYDYDPKKAAALLKEAGWILNKQGVLEKDGKPFSVTFYAPDGRYLMDKEIAGVVQDALKEVGIKVEIKILEWGAYLSAVDNGEHDMCFLGWSQGSPEPSTFLDYQFKSHEAGGWANDMFYEDPEVDALLDKGARVSETAERKAIFAEALEHIAQDAPMVPIYSWKLSFAARNYVKGYKHSVAVFDLTQVTVEK